jgi:uncharacterized repeat protein (TIGR03837 family)
MTAFAAPASPTPIWDIFCQVIDNFGDVGVCWRLAAELGARGVAVRLRIDDASALAWMAPQGAPNVQVLPYEAPYDTAPQCAPAVVIEAFGCEAPARYLAALATHHTQCTAQQAPAPVLVNLEYLSAEDYVERCHRLPSLLMSGPAAGMTRWFFYPGFTAQTGGLLREQALEPRQAQFDRNAWRQTHGISATACAVSLFCYEPPALAQLLAQLNTPQQGLQPHLLVTPGRATAAVQAHLQQADVAPHLQPTYLPTRPQPAFDEMLWACDLNLVRGEDSLVRALWAGQAFVWHIYPQDDNAHHAKLNAFLDWLQAPDSLRAFHHAWNGMTAPDTLPTITPSLLQEWRDCTLRARDNLRQQADLIAQLQQFVAEKS